MLDVTDRHFRMFCRWDLVKGFNQRVIEEDADMDGNGCV